jgi:hypothetical protein
MRLSRDYLRIEAEVGELETDILYSKLYAC